MKLSTYILNLTCCLLTVFAGGTNSLWGQATVSLTVSDQPMQPIIGLGFSIHKARGYYLPSNGADRQQLYQTAFDGFNSMVFWSYIENLENRDQLIAEAQATGLQHIIVNPIGEPQTPEEHAQNLFLEIHEYMTAGYPIYGTTLMNKPNTDESETRRVPPTFLTQCAKLLRAKLDSAGYNNLKIGGPSTVEWAPYIDPTTGGAAHGYSFVPGDNLMYLQAFLDDSAALAVLDAFDFQSYGWSVRDTVRKLAELHGKEQWVTLSALDGFNNQNDQPMLATALAANLLANINHGVGSWNHWVWEQLFDFNSYQPKLRFRYLQAIGQHFEAGAVARRVWADGSQPTPSMAWNYYDLQTPANNLQPEIVAAAALNPDSSLTIGIVNLSGIHAQHFFSEYHQTEARTFQVNLQVEELLGISTLNASPLVCQNSGSFYVEPTTSFVNGQVSFQLNSKDMILFRTDPIQGAVTSLPKLDERPALALFPNPAQNAFQVSLPVSVGRGRMNVQCLDLQGRIVTQWEGHWDPVGQRSPTFQLPSTCVNGLYVLRVSVDQTVGGLWQANNSLQVAR